MSGNGAVGASYGDLLVTSLIALAGVCIAAFVVVRLVGRLLATGRARGAQLLDVVARMPLEPRRSLYVVEVAGKALLIGTSEMGLSVLSELDREQVRPGRVERTSFGELVRLAWQRRRGVSAESSNASESAASPSPRASASRTAPISSAAPAAAAPAAPAAPVSPAAPASPAGQGGEGT
jgi:flagellar biogenesis protein FliO